MAILNDVRRLASEAMRSGDHGKGLSLALLMQRHFPDDRRTLQLLGELYLEGGRLDDAREILHRVLEIDPEDAVAIATLAIAAEEEEDLGRALALFELAFDVSPTNNEIAAEIARLHLRLNHNGPAQEPGSSTHAVARRLLLEGGYERAVPWLEEALRLDPDLTDVAVGLSRALWLSGEPKRAEEVAQEVLAEQPDCLVALAVVAAGATVSGRADAIELLGRTAELDPGNDVARALFEHAGLAFPDVPDRLHIPDSELAEVVPPGLDRTEASEERVSLDETPPALDHVAEVESAPADLLAEELAESREGAEAVREGSATEWLAAAREHAAAGQVGHALAEYRQALRLDPSAAPAVRAAVLSVLESDPENPTARWLAGDAMVVAGQLREGVEQYLRVLGRGEAGATQDTGSVFSITLSGQ